MGEGEARLWQGPLWGVGDVRTQRAPFAQAAGGCPGGPGAASQAPSRPSALTGFTSSAEGFPSSSAGSQQPRTSGITGRRMRMCPSESWAPSGWRLLPSPSPGHLAVGTAQGAALPSPRVLPSPTRPLLLRLPCRGRATPGAQCSGPSGRAPHASTLPPPHPGSFFSVAPKRPSLQDTPALLPQGLQPWTLRRGRKAERWAAGPPQPRLPPAPSRP